MMDISNPHFEEPSWLWLTLLALLALVALHWYAAVARRRQLAQVVALNSIAELTRSHSPARRNLKQFLLLAAVGFMGLALARPQWGELESRGKPFVDDVVFVLDCSRSMLANDVQPDRLSRAKYSILNFVRRHGKGRVGLVAFAGGAFLQCPLTFDYGAFEDALNNLDARAIPVGGTDVGHALQEANQAMDKKGKRKLIVLLTDGEDLEKSGVKEAETLATNGVTVFTIGVGTPAGVELRAPGRDGKVDFVRDENGQVVRSRLDETTLRAIAKATGGDYYPLGRLGEGLAKMRHTLETAGTIGVAHTRGKGVERYYVALALALLLLVGEPLIGTRRRQAAKVSQPGLKPAVIATLLLALGTAFNSRALDATNVVSTNQVSTNAVLTNAFSFSPPSPIPVKASDCFNVGTRKFALGKLDEAETLFQTVLERQVEPLQPVTLYNVGHVRFAQGAAELKKAPAEKSIRADSTRAVAMTADAIEAAAAALATDKVPTLVAAYQRGRGAQRELSEAFTAVRRALEAHGVTLEKWGRAMQDFRGSAELQLPGTNAHYNAEVVERAIAKLIDSDRQKQILAMKMAAAAKQLQELMNQLKGRIPKDELAKCSSGEEGEGEPNVIPVERPAGPQEIGSREGSDMELSLSPEQAAALLENFSPVNRRLSMSKDGKKGNPKEPKVRDW